MKVLVTGDRNWTSLETIYVALNWLVNQFDVQPKDVTLVEGEARGADKGCRVVAEGMGMTVAREPAHWRHDDPGWVDVFGPCASTCREMVGRPAGVIRNQRMLDKHFDVKVCLVFHDDLEHSKGTADMVRRCKRTAVPAWHFQTGSSSPRLL